MSREPGQFEEVVRSGTGALLHFSPPPIRWQREHWLDGYEYEDVRRVTAPVEQRIATIVVAALREELQPLIKWVESQSAGLRERSTTPALVDAAGAAHYLGITEHAFRSRLQRGEVPRSAIVRTGRRLQFRIERLVRER